MLQANVLWANVLRANVFGLMCCGLTCCGLTCCGASRRLTLRQGEEAVLVARRRKGLVEARLPADFLDSGALDLQSMTGYSLL